MPSLKDLATNLPNFKYYSGFGTFKQDNLPFGNDRPGNGDSGQPFVVRAKDQRWSPSNFDDGLTKFGAVTLATRTAADLDRVSSFLFSTYKGPLFLAKQTGLQRSNPNIRQLDASTTDRSIIRTQIYNPLGVSTLAETAIVGFGQHLTKHGLIPGFDNPNTYERFIKTNDQEGVNRLQSLTKNLSATQTVNILRYAGGPESFLGIGTTTIKRTSYLLNNKSVDAGSPNNPLGDGFIGIPVRNLQTITPYGKDILVDPTIDVDPPAGPTNRYNLRGLNGFQDFRKYKNLLNAKSDPKGYQLAESDYENLNIERRIGVARVRPADDRSNYASTGSFTEDRINAISLYYSNAPVQQDVTISDINGREVKAETIRDIVKFRIKSYDNDRPGYGVYMIFRAYLNNIKRGVAANWETYKYVGRGETFKAYDSFSETITLTFTIAASTRQEMKPLYQKLNYLMSTMTPDYKNAKARGNIAELTIGDFILYQPGIITNLDMVVDEDSNWEIALTEPESGVDADMHELPHIIRCNMTFVPIYNFLPRKSSESPFFGIDGLTENKTGKQWLKGTQAKLDNQKTLTK